MVAPTTALVHLVLHPKLSQSIALLATTIGRDKVYRLIQYLSRFIAWSLIRNGQSDVAARWDGLKNGLGGGRKLMRLFKPAEHLQSATNLALRPVANLNGPGQLAQVTQLGRQLCYAVFLTTDSVSWLNTVRFLRFDKNKLERLNRVSMKFWLFGIALSLVSSSASMVKLRADSRRFALSAEVARREGREKGPEEAAAAEGERRERGRALLAQRQAILSQLVMDACDIWIPANNLGYSNLNDGVIGILGATTSYMALQTQWAKHAAAGLRKTQ
ncbi:Peroxisomal membrane protein PMP27 [Cryptotrichosporon argae]